MARPKRTVAAAAQTKAAEVKEEMKETVKETVKEAVKMTEAVKAAAKAAAPKAAPAEAAPKAPAAPKATPANAAPAAKAAAPAPAEVEKTVVVEFAGKQIKAKDVLAQAEKAYAQSHPGVEIKSVELYISPEQNAAFYVVNGEASENFRIEL